MADIRSFFTTPKAVKSSTSGKSEPNSKVTPHNANIKAKSSDLVKAPKREKSRSSTGDDDFEREKENTKKKKKRVVIDSDSDEEPLPAEMRKKKEKSKSKQKKVESVPESDEEDIVMTYSSSTTKKQTESVKKREKVDEPKKEVLKPTTASDFFGSAPIQRSNDPPKVKKQKSTENQVQEVKKLDPDHSNNGCETPANTNGNMNGDDNSTKKRKRVEEIDEDIIEPTPPPKKLEKSSSLSSKLSSKLSSLKRDQEIQNGCNLSETSKPMSSDANNELSKSKAMEVDDSDKQSLSTSKKESSVKKDGSSKKSSTKKDADHIDSPPKAKIHSKKDAEPKTPAAESIKKEAAAEATPDANTSTSGTPATADRRKSYWAYKNREGPSALGSKEIPTGAEDCLEGLAFVITGVLEAFEREAVQDCIQRHGGKVTSAVSGKTSYVIVGRDPGQSKMDKVAKHKTKVLNEDEFIELVQTRPGKKPAPEPPKKKVKEEEKTPQRPSTPKSLLRDQSKASSNFKQSISSPDANRSSSQESSKSLLKESMSPISGRSSQESSKSLLSPSVALNSGSAETLLWVDKYKPAEVRKIVGQQGAKSNVNKLKAWLMNWFENNKPGAVKKGGFFAGKEDGSIFKAALLSGPPGVGKTTSATLVCNELKFDYVELNASDTRGKKLLEGAIKESLSNTSVDGLLEGGKEKSKRHVLIMDEVDGMAGNEDRGGMAELIQLIKKSKIPIICMCNDRNHPKVRSLANHCFDLRYYKPRVEQIKAFALSVAAKEGLKIPPQAMEQIVVGANQDIRQVLHNLQMWTANSNSMTYDEAKANAQQAGKNIKLGPFEIIRQLLSVGEASKMNIYQKTDLFFMDYSFIPLFMQENYLQTNPAKANNNNRKTLELMSGAADSLADSALVESLIRGSQNWSLLPLQGYFSTVLPSDLMAGYMGGRIEFPRWLGKNSSRNKTDRILQDLKVHMSVTTNANKSDINMDYISVLRQSLMAPLIDTSLDPKEAAEKVISLMGAYNLTREDWDSIMEIGKWGTGPDPVSKIPSKVKSAFTRQYNKESHMAPYAIQQNAKKAKATSSNEVLVQDEDRDNVLEEEEEDDSEDISKDAMIKAKKVSAAGGSGKGKGKSKKKADSDKATSKKASAGGSSAKGKGKSKK